MSKAQKKKVKPGLDLFLTKAKCVGLPKKHSILRRDRTVEKKHKAVIQKWERELEEARGPILKASLESLGMGVDELKKVWMEEKKVSKKYRQMKTSGLIPEKPYQVAGIIVPGDPVECRFVTVLECQQKVCVDQPVPVSVDNGWHVVDGSFNWVRQYDRFTLDDSVWGDDYWNWSGHHRTGQTHEGDVEFRAGAELVQQATVRQIGVRFAQWSSGDNGAYVRGDDGPLPGRDCGKAKQYVSFQLLSKIPGGNWITHVPISSVEVLYNDLENCWSRPPGYPYVYPPTRYVDLNQVFPAGTEFVMEIQLRYWIDGWGYNGHASVSYSLEVQPYMNLEACSWQWP